MGILGIENRDENWKTAQYFGHLSDQQLLNFVEKLGGFRPSEVHLELFWSGTRDYLAGSDGKAWKSANDHKCEIAKLYTRLFPNLRGRIADYDGFAPLKPHNYDAAWNQGKLFNNIGNTEIDIVLQTPKHLFIGEAKYKSNLRGNSNLVLVHQLIRQYVMATILVEIVSSRGGCHKKAVVPFVVV